MAKDSTGTLLLLAAAGVGVYGWMQGWFAQFGLSAPGSSPAPSPNPNTGTSSSGGATVKTPAGPVVPALGTVIHNAADLAAQVAAKDAYIFPDNSLIGSPPVGYVMATDATGSETGSVDGKGVGTFYLRLDIAQAVLDVINTINSASGAPVASLQDLYRSPVSNLKQIQGIMTAKGLSGLGDYRRYLQSRGIYA